MYVIIVPYAFSGIFDPSIRSLVSAQTKSNEQGELQGIFTSLMSLAEMIGPVLMMWIFYKASPYATAEPIYYGAPFFFAGFVALISFVIMRFVFRKVSASKDELIDESFEE